MITNISYVWYIKVLHLKYSTFPQMTSKNVCLKNKILFWGAISKYLYHPRVCARYRFRLACLYVVNTSSVIECALIFIAEFCRRKRPFIFFRRWGNAHSQNSSWSKLFLYSELHYITKCANIYSSSLTIVDTCAFSNM